MIENYREEKTVYEVYSNSKYGFSIKYPIGWMINTSNEIYGEFVAFIGPGGLNINISFGPTYGSKESIEDLKHFAIRNVRRIGGEIISLRSIIVDDVDAVEVIYTVSGFKRKKVGFVKDGNEYVITCGTKIKWYISLIYKFILSSTPDKFDEYETIFDECIQSFKFDKLFGKDKKTDDARTHYFSGVSYQQKGLYKEAEKEYLKAIELNPEHYKAYCNLGSICAKKERVKEAEKYYKKALQINPHDPITLFDLGHIYFIYYNEDKGLEYFCKAIIADPTIEPKVHHVIHLLSYHPNEDIQKLNKLFNEQLRKIYSECGAVGALRRR